MQVPGRPVPNTFEYIEAIALREPQRLAIVQDEREWNYRSVYFDLVRIIRVLNELGIRRGDRVAVGMSTFQRGLLLLIAAENLGAATLSFLYETDPDVQQLVGLVDWVLSDAKQEVPAHVRYVAIDKSFDDRMAAADIDDAQALPRIALEPAEPQRISRTSGSSGRSKFMVQTRNAQEGWLAGAVRAGRLFRDSRVLLVGPLVLNGQFARASACLRMGAAVFDLTQSGLQGRGLTHVCALPLMLEEVLRSLPPGYVAPRPMLVFSTGGSISASLRERLLRAFGGPVASRYGTNEVGSICEEVDENGVGTIAPGTDVRIVNDEGREVPFGEPGIICVRTPTLVEAYLDNPAATQAAFQGGWFRTGDWGMLVAPRVLRVVGRHDDLINVGGIKVPAHDVEAAVRKLVGPLDCAVLATNVEGGAATLGIALVIGDTIQREAVRRTLASKLSLGAPVGVSVLFLQELPRMGNGKVDRIALQRLFNAPPPGGA